MIRLAKRLGAHHVTNANSQMQTRDLLGGQTCLQQLQTVPDPIAICGALVAHLWRCINMWRYHMGGLPADKPSIRLNLGQKVNPGAT